MRRLVWLSLFVGGCALFVSQVVLSCVHFLSWPVSVDVKINYNESILFPVVTLCNINTFKYNLYLSTCTTV